ncbi:MAG: hypothetical protein COA96_16720 [SAR86 cluster bacterium]|uniref:Uncharacterized protein n=1 Tax=SAR86 cluster bacterium TaxID=2030880 RepID=A0A2A5AG58_9GAMM|nr:MAG: hypothetical protein COA96_16720 [SAR86 cluster bacterium]
MADFSQDIRVDLSGLDDIISRLGRLARKTPAIITKSLRAATKSSRKRIIVQALTILNIKKSSINSRVKITKTPTRASPSSRIRIKESGAPNLISFKGTRQNKTGVRAKPRKDGPVELHKGHFIQFSTKGLGGEQGQKVVMSRKYVNGKRVGRKTTIGTVGPTLIGRVLLRQEWISKERKRYADDINSEIDGRIVAVLKGGK